jgi:hypothetical protein
MAAVTRIQDIISPEVLADQITAKFPDKMVLGNTNLVEIDTTVPLGSPGTEFKMPAFKRVADFVAMTEGTALTTSGVTTYAEFATVQRGGGAYAVYDTASLVSKADPGEEIVKQLSQKAARYLDGALVLEAAKTPNTFDQTGLETTGFVTQNAIIKALVTTIGDNFMDMLSGGKIIMHSKVYGDLVSLGAIQNQYQFNGDVMKTGMIGTLMGLPILISDLVQKATVSSVLKYQTYIVGPGSLALFYQRNVQVEFDRDTLSKEDVISADVHFAAHLFGWDDKTNAQAAEDAKSIHVVNIKSN